MIQDNIIKGNRIIDEFMEVEPVIEYCVGKDDSICYSPSNLKEYFPNSYSQKIESERWLKEQHEKYPSGWVTKEGYGVKGIVHYTNYHSDWNYLMPVVEKIENIDGRPVTIENTFCVIDGHDEWSATAETKIKATWQAVVEFIKFYNQNKQS